MLALSRSFGRRVVYLFFFLLVVVGVVWLLPLRRKFKEPKKKIYIYIYIYKALLQ